MGALLRVGSWPVPGGTRTCESRFNSQAAAASWGRILDRNIRKLRHAERVRARAARRPPRRAADALHGALGRAAADGAIRLPGSPRRTLVAMSGGVDSAVAAQLALDRGDTVVAVTLELWADPAGDGTRSCCSPEAVVGARALAHRMGLPHITLDVRERFRDEVVADFAGEYAAG